MEKKIIEAIKILQDGKVPETIGYLRALLPSHNPKLNLVSTTLGETIVDVEYDYLTAEKSTKDYPGCAEQYSIESVWWSGVNVMDFIHDVQLMELYEKIKK